MQLYKILRKVTMRLVVDHFRYIVEKISLYSVFFHITLTVEDPKLLNVWMNVVSPQDSFYVP